MSRRCIFSSRTGLGVRLAAALACIAWLAAVGCMRASHPDVLLITVDTLRADALGCYGRRAARTPAIDHLAAEGVRFESAFSPRGATVPALTTILTGVPPMTHGVLSNGLAFTGDLPTLTDLLHAEGYRTGAFLTNHCATLVTRDDQVTRGFDVRRCAQLPGKPQHAWDLEATEAALQWLAEDPSVPSFTWVHLIDPHAPHDPPASLLEEPVAPALTADRQESTIRAIESGETNPGPEVLRDLWRLYDAEVAGADERIGRLVKAARKASPREVVVVLAADHGEELFDHDHLSGHNYSIYDSVLHVPLVIVAPGAIPPATTSAAFADLQDVLPTIADLLDLDAPSPVEGRSLLPRIRDRRPDPRDAVIGSWNEGILTVRTPRWRFVWNRAPWRKRAGETRGVEITGEKAERLAHFRREMLLFDHDDDPAEKNDLIAERLDPPAELRERLARWFERHEALGIDYREIDDTRVTEELHRLGYL